MLDVPAVTLVGGYRRSLGCAPAIETTGLCQQYGTKLAVDQLAFTARTRVVTGAAAERLRSRSNAVPDVWWCTILRMVSDRVSG